MRSDMNNRLTGASLALLASVVTSFGCSSSDGDKYKTIDNIEPTSTGSPSDGNGNGNGSTGTSTGGASSGPGGSPNNQAAGNVDIGGLTLTNAGSSTAGETCAASDTPTKLQGVALSFVFDVSASMGNGQFPYFSRTLKWDPVVAATKAFFEDTESRGLSATLTFFPNENAPIASSMTMGGPGGSMGAECVAADYATPDVPLTLLPSPAFGAAIDAVTPADADSWRLGTPTLPALEGAIQGVQAMQAADPNTRYVMVLVTDGMPALCPGPDGESVQAVADAAAAVAATIPTYVIGVNNPVTDEEPNPPDTVSDLNLVAVAGGTDAAYIIDTTDPANTATQLKEIIDTIRDFSFSCSLAIPAPTNGEEFDKNKVNVQYSSPSLGDIPFEYDPTCTADNGWFYDDEANPSSIQICNNVCDQIRVQQDEGQLSIALGCVTRIY